jgi:hypothetical protein
MASLLSKTLSRPARQALKFFYAVDILSPSTLPEYRQRRKKNIDSVEKPRKREKRPQNGVNIDSVEKEYRQRRKILGPEYRQRRKKNIDSVEKEYRQRRKMKTKNFHACKGFWGKNFCVALFRRIYLAQHL